MAQPSGSWCSGGFCQRPSTPQAAPGSGQPRPISRISRLGGSGRPHRACIRHRCSPRSWPPCRSWPPGPSAPASGRMPPAGCPPRRAPTAASCAGHLGQNGGELLDEAVRQLPLEKEPSYTHATDHTIGLSLALPWCTQNLHARSPLDRSHSLPAVGFSLRAC